MCTCHALCTQVKMTLRVAGAADGAADGPTDTTAAHALLSLSAPDSTVTPVQRQQQQLAKLMDTPQDGEDAPLQSVRAWW